VVLSWKGASVHGKGTSRGPQQNGSVLLLQYTCFEKERLKLVLVECSLGETNQYVHMLMNFEVFFYFFEICEIFYLDWRD
jgi:hypothetical protein